MIGPSSLCRAGCGLQLWLLYTHRSSTIVAHYPASVVERHNTTMAPPPPSPTSNRCTCMEESTGYSHLAHPHPRYQQLHALPHATATMILPNHHLPRSSQTTDRGRQSAQRKHALPPSLPLPPFPPSPHRNKPSLHMHGP